MVEKVLQGGDAHMKSGHGICLYFHLRMSLVYVAFDLGSISTLMTSKPITVATFPTDPVPENSSRSKGFMLFGYLND
jgi:hypothetical protein